MTAYGTSCLAKALLLSSSFAVLANAGKISSSVRVHLPKNLARPSGYDHREALFGIPPYGGSIQQNVIYAEEDMCSAAVKPHWKSPFILLVDRGGCSFVQKVRNAQHSGAAAVIIADNTCQCSHDKVCTPELNTECEKHEPIMADDGSGYDITIPSVLLFKQDADPIKEALIHNHSVRIELTWSVPNTDDHVDWDLWTSPTDYVSGEFKHEFKSAIKALGERASFTPHMYIYDGLSAECRNSEGENQCFNLCTNNGRYCAADPDNDLEYGISGADVVTESLRRLCIWELYGTDGVGIEWWDYVSAFIDKCDTSVDFMKEECVQQVMTEIGMDYDMVDQCIFNHGGLEDDGANDLLDVQLDEKDKNGIIIMPVAYINGVAVRGALEYATIFKAICAGYAFGQEPSICTKCATCPDEKGCVESGGKCASMPKGDGVDMVTYIMSLGGVIGICAVVGYALYAHQQRVMKDQVRGILKEYMPLDVQNDNVVSAVDEDEDKADGVLT